MLLNAPKPPMKPDPEPPPAASTTTLLSDEPTIELVISARAGNRLALEALLERCLPPVKRWAHGRLPAHARGALDTGDLVQEAAMHVLARLDKFEPRHVGAMQAYLRMSVVNRIRDEIRRATRSPAAAALDEEQRDRAASPLEMAIGREAVDRYEAALTRLRPEEREAIVARVEMECSYQEVADALGKPSADAARMTVSRALLRLAEEMNRGSA